jgi:hypothetical protein
VRRASNNRFSERYPLLHRVTLPQAWNVEANEQRECNAQFNRVEKLLREARELLPLASMFLNSRQHDAQLIAVERTATDITIWMEDFQLHCLSAALETIPTGRLQNSRGRFPIGFKFCGLSSLSMSRINQNDKILPLAVSRYLPRLNEFLYDEVTRVSPDCVSIGMLILANCQKRAEVDLLVEVECRKLEFIERQRSPFEALYSDQYPGLFDAFQLERCEKHRCFDHSNARRFVLEEFLDPNSGSTRPLPT